MPPHIEAIVAVYGYGPFLYAAMPMLAAAIHVWGGRAAATIALAVFTAATGMLMALSAGFFPDVYWELVRLDDRAYSGVPLENSRARSTGRFSAVPSTSLRDIEALELRRWMPAPLMGLTLAILLPRRWKVFGLLLAGFWLSADIFGFDSLLSTGPADTSETELAILDWIGARLAEMGELIRLVVRLIAGEGEGGGGGDGGGGG